MLRVYPWNEKSFEGNGLAALLFASDVYVERKINGDATLHFKLPPDDRTWEFVKEEAVVILEKQRYRIKRIDGTSVTAYPVYQDACGHHIQSTGEYIGEPGYTVFEKLFDGVDEVRVLSASEVSGLGMEPISGESGNEDKIDFFEQSKVTPIGALKYLQEQLEKNNIHNELYYDNDKIALVRALGSNKGAKIDLRLNASEIEPSRDTTELITKLYPYGSGDIHIGSETVAGYYDINGEVIEDAFKIANKEYCYQILNDDDQFIVSPYADNYPVHEGHMSFDDVTNVKDLIQIAAKQFESSNPERIDVAKYTVKVSSLAKIGVPIGLGDLVEVNDRQFKVKTLQRVVSEKYYPYEPSKTSVTVGQPETNILEMFGGVLTKTAAMMSDSGKVKSSWLENIKSTYRTQINEAFNDNKLSGRSTVVHDYGDIWVNPNNPNQALAIIGGRLAIANGKTTEDEDGDWNWTAFGDWSGFTADVMTSGVIKTELIKLMGNGAKMEISNNMITFKETRKVNNSETIVVRARWGYDEDEDRYIFEMYDDDNNQAMYLDENGDLRLAGILDTRKNEEGQSGYLIEDSNIIGQKYTGTEFIPHGLEVSENEYGSHLTLYKDGKEHFHTRAFVTSKGIAAVDLAVNNSGVKGTDPDNDSWTFIRAFEGEKRALSEMHCDWDVNDSNMSFFIGKTSSDGHVNAGKYAFTGRFFVKMSDNGSEYIRQLHFVNGLLMGMTKDKIDWL